MSLELLQVPKSKEVLKNENKTDIDELCWKSGGANWKNSQGSKPEEFEQQNKVVLDYNPKYEMNIHESLLI